MILETIPVGPLQCNCVILGCGETGRALVIDPGEEADRILEILAARNLTVEAILHTHAHLDHVGATQPLAEATGAPILLHGEDQPLYDHVELQAQMFGLPTPPTLPVDRHVVDGEAIHAGSIRGEILHTPGHSLGSLCLHLPEARDPRSGRGRPILFAGDTLFCGGIGRTDLWGGDFDRILRSIRERILTLPDETLVVPGHGPMTSVGAERASNPFLR